MPHRRQACLFHHLQQHLTQGNRVWGGLNHCKAGPCPQLRLASLGNLLGYDRPGPHVALYELHSLTTWWMVLRLKKLAGSHIALVDFGSEVIHSHSAKCSFIRSTWVCRGSGEGTREIRSMKTISFVCQKEPVRAIGVPLPLEQPPGPCIAA